MSQSRAEEALRAKKVTEVEARFNYVVDRFRTNSSIAANNCKFTCEVMQLRGDEGTVRKLDGAAAKAFDWLTAEGFVVDVTEQTEDGYVTSIMCAFWGGGP